MDTPSSHFEHWVLGRQAAKFPRYGGFAKLGVPFWGSPIIKTIVLWGSILGNYHIEWLRRCWNCAAKNAWHSKKSVPDSV